MTPPLFLRHSVMFSFLPHHSTIPELSRMDSLPLNPFLHQIRHLLFSQAKSTPAMRRVMAPRKRKNRSQKTSHQSSATSMLIPVFPRSHPLLHPPIRLLSWKNLMKFSRGTMNQEIQGHPFMFQSLRIPHPHLFPLTHPTAHTCLFH